MITNDVQPGQRVRVTILKDVIATDDEMLAEWERTGVPETHCLPGGRFRVPKKIAETAGTVYEGFASDITTYPDSRFFDLNLDNGEAVGFIVDDPEILIEAL